MKRTCEGCIAFDDDVGCINGIGELAEACGHCDSYETSKKFWADVLTLKRVGKILQLHPQWPALCG